MSLDQHEWSESSDGLQKCPRCGGYARLAGKDLQPFAAPFGGRQEAPLSTNCTEARMQIASHKGHGGIEVALDHFVRTLYVYRVSEKTATSTESKSDGHLIFDLNEKKEIVGLRLLNSDISVDEWERHPDYEDVPRDLSYAVRCWLTEHGV